MKQRLKIAVLVDPSTIPNDDPEFADKPKVPITEYHVIEALRTLGHEVSIVGAVDEIGIVVKRLTDQKPDIVFNLTEHFSGDRRKDKNIAALLELLDIPFTGTGAGGLLLSRDKRLCKRLLSLHKIRVPNFVSFSHNKKIHVSKNIRFPLVVKPVFEDSSEGISNASLVYDKQALQERVEFIHEQWQQAAIAEEYIDGRELYVCILGNKKLTVFPIRECFFEHEADYGPLLLTYRLKWNEKYRRKWKITFGFAELEPSIQDGIYRICKRAYRLLLMRDYGRIDLRLTHDNRLVVLEANPNPDIAYGEEVAEAAEKAGLPYEQFIDRILQTALRRYS